METSRILTLDSQGVYQRNDFSEPRVFHLPIHVRKESESEVVYNSLRPHGLQPLRLLRPQDFPGKSTGVGCHFPYIEKH